MTLLSITRAADLAPKSAALMTRDRSFSFGELARLAKEREVPKTNVIRATDPLQTALCLYASLEKQRPLVVLPATGFPGPSDLSDELLGQIPPNIALVLFTSGSTGTPRGVMLSRSALCASAKASEHCLGWFGDDRWLCCLPLSHIGGLSILLRCLLAQKTAVLAHPFRAKETYQSMLHSGATHVSLVPTMVSRLLNEGPAPKSLQVALVGGASTPPALAQKARQAGYPLRLTYGMTETASQVITDGRPLKTVEIRIKNERLEIAGPMLLDGGIDLTVPVAKAVRLRQDRWFSTNDRATIGDDGTVTILGRSDDTIISGGENVDPRLVEASLLAMPSVEEAYALGLDDPEWGQKLVALVVLRGELPRPEELGLERHERPKKIIAVPSLPLLPNGKIDRRRAIAIAMEAT